MVKKLSAWISSPRLTFLGEKNVTGFSSRPLKNYMSSACLLHQIQYIQNSWLHSMTDFNKLRYRPVIEFLTLENVWPQQINKRMTVVYTVKMRHHMPWSSAGLLSFVKAEEAFKTRPGRGGRDVHPKLSARNCRATEHTVLQNHQLANGVSNSTGRVK